MKLRNKQNPNKFGKILAYDAGKDGGISVKTDEGVVWFYHSLAELNEEWEDAPEKPKEYWYVSCDGRALKATTDEDDYNEKHITGHKEIGNYFETKEETEKAVEKLKALKILKDKGFRFIDWELDMKTVADGKIWFDVGVNTQWDAEHLLECEPEVKKLLDLLFGGEE